MSAHTLLARLSAAGVPHGYLRVLDTYDPRTKKWASRRRIWCGTKACYKQDTPWAEAVKGNERRPKSGLKYTSREAALETGNTATRNVVLAFPTHAFHVLDIDDMAGFAAAFPHIDLSVAPQYLSRNKRLPHVLVRVRGAKFFCDGVTVPCHSSGAFVYSRDVCSTAYSRRPWVAGRLPCSSPTQTGLRLAR